MEKPPVIRITVDGRLALTISQAAARHDITPSRLRQDLAREPDAPQPIAPLDARTPLYNAAAIKAFVKRPSGVRGKPRTKRAS